MSDQINDLSFQHLQLEFARLDVLLHRLVHRRRAAQPEEEEGGPWPGFHLSEAQAYGLLQRPFGHGPGALDGETETAYASAMADVEAGIGALHLQAEQESVTLRLVRLASLLGLSRADLDFFLLAVAPVLDVRYGRLYSYLQDDLNQQRPTVGLALDVFGEPHSQRLHALAAFEPGAPLLRHRLVQLQGENGQRPFLVQQAIYPDEALAAWLLLGDYRPPGTLLQTLTFERAPRVEPVLLAQGTVNAVETAVSDGDLPLLLFHGPDGTARQTAAAMVAATAGRPLLTLNLAAAMEAGVGADDALALLLRDALLMEAVAHVRGWDACFADGAPPAHLLERLHNYPDPVILSSAGAWHPRGMARRRPLRRLAFPKPETAQRLRLLRHFLKRDGEEMDADLTALAGQFTLSTGQLRDLVATARDLAAQAGDGLGGAHLFAAARAHSSPRLATLGRKLTPRFQWDDLVLPADGVDLLKELVATVRSRPLVLEEWGVGRKLASSAGITALFYGPPGTGKTMAAEVIAGDLGLDLYKIELSGVISKYIGETEKNLERIFDEAEQSNAILFFDEADAIFGKRSEVKDAHDRYANIETSYLLQRMEAYNGVTILATNLRANLDEAFTRRLQFAVSFPFPEAADRLRIWRTLLPADVPAGDDLDFEWLAEQFDLAGGNIRNVLVTAAYLAASNGQMVTMEHLLHGVRRELQKMGRLVSERDLER